MIGLTGGIASGKSTVTSRLRALGAFVADADIVSREVMEQPEVLGALREAFGSRIFHPDGSLDRAACASVVFSSPERTKLMNGVTHPAIAARLRELARSAEQSGEHTLVFVDAALLIESGFHRICDKVWLITANTASRIRRIMDRDGLTYEEATARIARQMPDEEKLPFASTVIENDGSIEELIRKVDEAYAAELAALTPDEPEHGDFVLDEIREIYEEE